MSSDLFYGSIQDFETSIQNKIATLKEGRQEVSNGHYLALALAMVVIVGCLAAQNAFYGYSQGSTYTAMVLLAVMYFAGDWALAALTSLSTKQKSIGILSVVAKTGLILLSVTAGTSFMLSQQHEKEVNNSRVSYLEQQIEINKEAFSQYHKTITAERLERLNSELETERKRVGANHASSNAVYVYIATLTGYSFEVVSFLIRTLWTIVFILTGMTLSTLLGLLWCPWKETRTYSSLLNQQRRQIKRASTQMKLLRQQSFIQNEIKKLGSSGTPQSVNKHRGTRAPTQDTRTTGDTSNRYQNIREKVTTGEVRPSIASFKRLGMGTATAQEYLKQLHDEGVIRRVGQGYTTLMQ